MGQSNSLSLSYVSPDKSWQTDDFVLLEQEPITVDQNVLTKAGLVDLLSYLVLQTPVAESRCVPPGVLDTNIFAYPSRPDLAYSVGLSHGELGKRSILIIDFAESIQCNLETTLNTKYPPLSITGYQWVGDAYDREGSIIARPAVTIGAHGLILAAPIYGTLVILYRTVQHQYPVQAVNRQDATENALSVFTYAVWDGGNTSLEIKAPAGTDSGQCGTNWSSSGHVNEFFDPGYITPETETHYIDYCTNKEIGG